MGRGKKRQTQEPIRGRAAREHGLDRSADCEPAWGRRAADFYRASYSDDYVVQELEHEGHNVSAEEVGDYLRGRRDIVRRRPPPVHPFNYPRLAPEMTTAVRHRIDELAEALAEAGDGEVELSDFYREQFARYSHVEHLCFSNEQLFNSELAVACFIRRLKKWHVAVGRPVGGEAFEDVLAGTWRDLGHTVFLTPRNYDGADAHVEVENQWVAVSMKSETREKQSRRSIHLTSLAPHDVDIETPHDCVLAVEHAIAHLDRYERMIYLRAEEDTFPSGWSAPGCLSASQRYTLLELPKADIAARLRALNATDFGPHFANSDEAAARNSFSVRVDDEQGRRLFTVTVSRRPPRVAVTAIDFDYCDLIASYWTERVDKFHRLDRIHAESGFFRSGGDVPRYDV